MHPCYHRVCFTFRHNKSHVFPLFFFKSRSFGEQTGRLYFQAKVPSWQYSNRAHPQSVSVFADILQWHIHSSNEQKLYTHIVALCTSLKNHHRFRSGRRLTSLCGRHKRNKMYHTGLRVAQPREWEKWEKVSDLKRGSNKESEGRRGRTVNRWQIMPHAKLSWIKHIPGLP